MKIGIFAKPHRTEFSQQMQAVLRWLHDRDCQTVVEESVVANFQLEGEAGYAREEIPRLADAIIVFGGDGTMLSVVRLVQGNSCPILGVNMGSLGFLTAVTMEELFPALQQLVSGAYRTERRRLLKTELAGSSNPRQTYHALNDAVINKGAPARVISLDAFINGDFIANFVADGMIVSTPTGSTAYSLSAGGPIVLPALKSILITPICPHTLTNRPVIVPDDHELRFVLKSGDDVRLTIDGQLGAPLQEGDEVICTSSPFQVEFVLPHDKTFFNVLREKLKWGARS